MQRANFATKSPCVFCLWTRSSSCFASRFSRRLVVIGGLELVGLLLVHHVPVISKPTTQSQSYLALLPLTGEGFCSHKSHLYSPASPVSQCRSTLNSHLRSHYLQDTRAPRRDSLSEKPQTLQQFQDEDTAKGISCTSHNTPSRT